jgi:hypothetical protein
MRDQNRHREYVMAPRGRRKTDYLNNHFATYVAEFGTAFKRTSSIQHAGDRGSSRETAISGFLKDNLPRRYDVTGGEAVDTIGTISPQLDIMIYDALENFPIVASGHATLPAEALLASIEIKSVLNVEEIRKSILAAKKLRSLCPYGKSLGGRDVGSQAPQSAPSRFFHCLFAYGTDISEGAWLNSEYKRFVRENGNEHTIDAIYVLDRGLINVTACRGQIETSSGAAITNFYFSILNFLQREGGRRRVTPYDRYVTGHTSDWKPLAP